MPREMPNGPGHTPRRGKGCFGLIFGLVLTVILTLITGGSASAQTALPKVNVSGSNMVIGSKVFVPRGVNYLTMEADEITTFEVGKYDPAKAEAMFVSLDIDDYNHNRAFVPQGNWVNTGVGGGTSQVDTPFNPAVIANIVDYVKRGARHGVYTSLVLQDFPRNCYFFKIVGNGNCSTDYSIPNVYGVNATYLDPQYVKAKAEYMRLFAAEMVTQLGTDRTAILNYSSDNEATFQTDQAPFTNWDASTVTLLGKTYRMNVAAERQEAADIGFVNYVQTVKAALLQGDPAAKFTVGVYTNYAVNKVGFDGLAYCAGPAPCKVTVNYPDFRYPGRISKVLSIVDMAELHFYPRPTSMSMVPGSGTYTVAKDLATVEMTSTNMAKKPVMIGEWGAFIKFFPTVSQAATAMRDAQKAACSLGADGYDFWTFNTVQLNNQGKQDLWTLMDSNERINQDLYPGGRPNPCK